MRFLPLRPAEGTKTPPRGTRGGVRKAAFAGRQSAPLQKKIYRPLAQTAPSAAVSVTDTWQMLRPRCSTLALAVSRPSHTGRMKSMLPWRVTYPRPSVRQAEPAVDAQFSHLSEDAEPTVLLMQAEGQLYQSTGRESDRDGRCGIMDGQITDSVERNLIPSRDGQSNFGAPYGYQYGDNGQLELNMDGRWIIFEPAQSPVPPAAQRD